MRIVKRIIAIALLAIVVVLSAGVIYELYAADYDSKRNYPEGVMLEVDGRQVHLLCKGKQKAGEPIVLLESASDMMAADWAWVQDQLAGQAMVCAYDRAGFGWSDSSKEARSADRVVEELEALLREAKLEGPFVIAGHSVGALYAQVYAARNPEQVTGLVFVDPGHHEAMNRIPEMRELLKKDREMVKLLEILSYFGVPRLLEIGIANAGGLPQSKAFEMQMHMSRPKHWQTLLQAIDHVEATNEVVRRTPVQVGIPAAVISASGPWGPADKDGIIRKNMIELHAELSSKYSSAQHIIIEGADHGSIIHDRQHALQVAVVIQSILEGLE